MIIFKRIVYMPMLEHFVYVLEGADCMPSLTFSSSGSSFCFVSSFLGFLWLVGPLRVVYDWIYMIIQYYNRNMSNNVLIKQNEKRI